MFTPVHTKASLPNLEKEVLKFWQKNKIFEKSVARRKKGKRYVFFDGPPFANGLPHYGHILASALKDAVTRYATMQGYYVPRVNGWDCHGLPVEYEIEKELKISGRKQIVEYGVDRFNGQCRESVFRYTKEWEVLLKRIARWVDFDHSYATLDNDYMESIWWVFKQIWDKKMMYQGHRPMHICPRCETSLSNFEVTLGYKEVADMSITMKFPVKHEKNTYFLAWTTTPWSSLSVTGLAIGPDFDYVKVRTEDGSQYYLAEKRVEAVFKGLGTYEIVARMKGKDLVHKPYTHLYPFYDAAPEVKASKHAFHTVPADYVSVEDGTGIVTINGAFGEIDFESANKHGLPIFVNVGMDGCFTKENGHFAGMFVKDAEPKIAEDLRTRGLLLRKDPVRHSYPHCWRCDSPLLNYVMKSWFIRVTAIKDKLLANNQKIHWVPDHIRDGRFGKWLENVRDWNISRNRFWGCPLPIWICEQCETQECIGSMKELQKRSHGHKLPKRGRTLDLHKPFIDAITLQCSCGGTMRRISDVLDCWFESGAMPYAQAHYPFASKKIFEENFPAHFIAEGLDQTRGWFYTLHVLSTILFNRPAFKNIIVNGILLAADGEKLSKRKKNYPDPNVLFDVYGVDSVRFFLYQSTAPLAEDVRFSEAHVVDIVKRLTLPLWNTYSFFVLYANIDGWMPKKNFDFTKLKNPLDRWIISELHVLVREITKQMDDYNLTKATRPFFDFVDNLSNWYVRRSRRRFWKSESDADKVEAYQTLYTVLVTVSQLLAPFMPFLSDALYRNLVGQGKPASTLSVHMTDWPKTDARLIRTSLNKEIAVARTIVTVGHALRAAHQLKVRQPLASVHVALPPKMVLADRQKAVIAEELNVKELVLVPDVESIAHPVIKPNARVLGPKYGKHVQDILAMSRRGAYTVQKDGTVEIGEYVLLPEEFELLYEGKGNHTMAVSSRAGIVVALDTVVTPVLEAEGVARDVVRFIQELRKKAQYHVSDRITVFIHAPSVIAQAVTQFEDFIRRETLATELIEKGDFEGDLQEVVSIDGHEVTLAVRRGGV